MRKVGLQEVLLVNYPNMAETREVWKLNQKVPELIDLDSSDDEATDEASVVIVDLDESNVSGEGRNSEVSVSSSSNKLNLAAANCVSSCDAANANVIYSKVVNPVRKPDSPRISNSSFDGQNVANPSQDGEARITAVTDLGITDKIDSIRESSSPLLSGRSKSNVLQGSNKRKRKTGFESIKAVEVVEILDDDVPVIVLDDSVASVTTTPFCSSLADSSDVCIVESESENVCAPNPVVPQTVASNSSLTQSDDLSSPPHPSSSQSSSVQENVIPPSESDCKDSNTNKKQDSGPPKKKSKLAYHRPAHLITPLTKPAPGVPSISVNTVSNIYNPNADSTEKRTGLRPIVIDGNNVAVGHGKGVFSLKGLQICINYFEKRGHRQIKVFVPHYRLHRGNHNELTAMEKKGLVVLTPSRKVNGKVIASYDDRYIVQYAAEFGGIIVSTDNFRDLLKEDPSWKDTIEKRLLMFTWVDDMLMFPQDPLGRQGPSLDDLLKFPDS